MIKINIYIYINFLIFKNLYIGRSTFTSHYRVEDFQRAQEHKFFGARIFPSFYYWATTSSISNENEQWQETREVFIFVRFVRFHKDSLKMPFQYRRQFDRFTKPSNSIPIFCSIWNSMHRIPVQRSLLSIEIRCIA